MLERVESRPADGRGSSTLEIHIDTESMNTCHIYLSSRRIVTISWDAPVLTSGVPVMLRFCCSLRSAEDSSDFSKVYVWSKECSEFSVIIYYCVFPAENIRFLLRFGTLKNTLVHKLLFYHSLKSTCLAGFRTAQYSPVVPFQQA